MATTSLWQRFQQFYLRYDDIRFELDISRMRFPDDFLTGLEGKFEAALKAMKELEAGAIANPDEGRMVGHYWLRNSGIAPKPDIAAEITSTLEKIKKFAADVHAGAIHGAGGAFTDLLVIGIGGSALGPQFVHDALGTPADKVKVHFFDNTDPQGMDRVLQRLEGKLATTLVVVISKSGGTKETRNGMLEAEAAYSRAGLAAGEHFVAVTGDGSELDKHADTHRWIARFPMWDWVGGRTSVMSAVGLVPMALQGLDVDAFLAGAAAMDLRTRSEAPLKNAAMLLAAMWYYAGDGRGKKDMVVLPYKDRLVLFSKYLQQLVMESLGKEKDLDGNVVHQGIAVYGNKGSTDQHAYVQQLRDGVPNFFATLIEVREDREDKSMDVEPGATSGDYLQGFLRGTRAALYENARDTITVSIPRVDAFNVGLLIALYERAVGFYASLINVNAYHQPGVEAGKKAAEKVLKLQASVIAGLTADGSFTAEQIASTLSADPEEVFHILHHLAANGRALVAFGPAPADDRFSRP